MSEAQAVDRNEATAVSKFVRRQWFEWMLVGLVLAIVVLLNIPKEYTDAWGLRTDYLLIPLMATLGIALMLYLKFAVLLMLFLLIAGANVPSELAAQLNVSRVPFIIAMVVMVVISLANVIWKKIPTGLEEKPRKKSSEAAYVLFYAINKGNLVYAQKILNENYDPNLARPDGMTPLMVAAERGHAGMVYLLLRHDSDANALSSKGETALEIALRLGHNAVVDVLRKHRQSEQARTAAPVAA